MFKQIISIISRLLTRGNSSEMSKRWKAEELWKHEEAEDKAMRLEL